MTDLENPKYEDLDLKIDDSETELFLFDDTEGELDALWGDPKKQFDKLVKKIGKNGCSFDGRIYSNIDDDRRLTKVVNKVSVEDSRRFTKITVIYGTNMYYLRYNKKTKKFEKSSSFFSSRKTITDKEAKKRINEIDSAVNRIKAGNRLEKNNPFKKPKKSKGNRFRR